MAELIVTTQLDTSGFDSGVAKVKSAIAELSGQPVVIKVKLEGGYEKLTKDLAKVAIEQAKAEQAASRQAIAEANLAAQKERSAQADERMLASRARIISSENALLMAQERTAQGDERKLASQAKIVQAEERTKQSIEKTNQAALRANAQMSAGAEETAAATDRLATSVNRVSEAFTGWVTRNIWNSLRNGLRDALNTMKEMDTQLTTIRRVSGMSEGEVSKYQQQAYDVSSRYGVKPADYLSNVVAYTRAGYGDLAGDLAEVTTKLQVVGQVSQDVATQMLLAVDAAYKLEGGSEALGAVMDGVVAIGDHYATSVEKIAEGIGIIAPIAAQAHVGIDELSAAIGTITADTQRSGTEAARALRYVFLNILKNTSTEVEEGVTLTEDEIEGFQDVLEYFIPDVLRTADALGEVVNPMEALGAIAKGVDAKIIDEAELFSMLEKVAGKLRASQVLSLVRDWDKYSEMLTLFGNSVGETDSKVEVALSSWESKANMLSASFTKLFGNVLNSSMVKGGLDALKGLVDLLNVGDGAPAKMLAIGTAFSVITTALTTLAKSGQIMKLLSFFANPAFLGGAALSGVFLLMKGYADGLVNAQGELKTSAQEATSAYEEQKTKVASITAELEDHQAIVDSLTGKAGSLTAAEQARLTEEQKITEELRMQLQLEKEKEIVSARKAAQGAVELYNNGESRLDLVGAGVDRSALASAMLASGTPQQVIESIKGGSFTLSGGVVARAYASETIEMYRQVSDTIASIDKDLADAMAAQDTAKYGELLTQKQEYMTLSQFLETSLQGYYEEAASVIKGIQPYYDLIKDLTEENISSDDVAIKNAYESAVATKKIIETVMSTGEAAPTTTTGQDGSSGSGGSTATMTTWEKEQDAQLRRTQALVTANREYNETLQAGQKFARITAKTYKELEKTGIDFSKKLPGTDLDLSEAVIQDGESFIFLGEALEALNKQSKEWYEKYGIKMPDNFKEIADNADTVAGSFEDLLKRAGSMADEAAAASKALEELKKQLKADGEHGDVLSAYRTEYKTVMEMWKKGLYGSKELQGFMNLVLGDETMAKLGYNYKEAGKLLGNKFFKAMFAPGGKDDFGTEAIRYLYNNVANKAGNIVGENGEVVANLKKVNGEIAVTVNSFEGLAKVLGINTDVLLTLFDALGMYKNGLNTTGDDITKLLDSMGEGVSKLNNGVREVDLTKFINTLAANGSSIGEIFQLIQSMGGLKGVSFGDADIKDTAALYDKIKDAVSKANDKNFFLEPDASGFTSYASAAKAAMAEVDDAWAASQAAISGTPATPKMDTSNVQEGTGVLNGTASVFEHYVSEGDGAEASPTMNVSEVIAGMATLGLSLISFGSYSIAGNAATAKPSMVTDFVTAGISVLTDSAISAFNSYQTAGDGAEPKPGLITTVVEAGSAFLNGVANSVFTHFLSAGNAANPKPKMDTSDVAAGKTAVDSAIDLLAKYGIIDENAKAGIKTKLAGPEAEMAFATAALLLFGMIDEDATASIDARDIDGPKQTVEDAEKYLKEKFGITNVSAIAGLKNEIKPEDLATLAQTLLELWAYGRTYKATTVLEGDATDEQKAAALKTAADDLAKFKGRFTAQLEIQGLKVTDSAIVAALATSLNSLKDLYTTKVEVDTSQIEGAQALVADLEAKANATVSSMQEALAIQLGFNSNPMGGEGGGGKESNKPTALSSALEAMWRGASEAAYGYSDAVVEAESKTQDAVRAVTETEKALALVSEGAGFGSDVYGDEFAMAKDAERLSQVAEAIRGLIPVGDAAWTEDAKNALQIYSDFLDLFDDDYWEAMKASGHNELDEAIDSFNEAVDSIPEETETEVEVPGATESTGKIEELADAIDGLPEGKNVTIGVTWSPGMAPSAPSGFSDPMGALAGSVAEGTRNYPGGRSLVNELGPELIAYNGMAFVAGGGKPTIVNLPKGAMIFDAQETRSIVANSGGLPSGVIGSHAAGLSLTFQTPQQKGLSIIGALGRTDLGGLFGLTGDALADWAGTITGKDKGKGGGGKKPAVDNTDYWAIVEAHYKEVTAVADNATTNLEYQIQLLKDAWDDEKKPLDEQIKALQDLNSVIDRQITLLTRERDKLTKPIQDEVDALKEAKDIQDDQLELEERQKAVEEARAELQNAQNERTIRFYNKETGHWEWMADQKRIQSAQEALESAEKSLADFQYDLQIKALENEIKAIEAEYQEKFDALNADKQENEDTIYDLQQELKELERRYNEIMGPLEEEKEDRSRAKAALENAWTNAQFERRETPTGNLDLAISKTGTAGSIAGGGIKELQADLKTIANAYRGSQQNNTLASLGIQFGATPSYAGTSSVTTVGNSVTDSHDIVINGITLPASAAYQSLMDLANDLSIYVNYK